MVVIESAGITDVGLKRTGNEDALLLDSESNFYIVADGMGGHQAGEVASSLIVNTMRDYMTRFKDNSPAEEMDDVDETLSKEANRLLSSIHLANLSVNQLSHTQATYRGMGSTVSAVLFTNETLIAANVGDSPIYLIHNGAIEHLSVPHTVMAEHAAMAPEGAAHLGNELRHMLTRAMGIKETVAPDICEIPYFKDDMVVISSDGLSDKVTPDEILEIVNTEKPGKACQKLVDLANERGGDDNITVIVAKVRKTLHGKCALSERLSRIGTGLLNSFKKISK